MNIDTFEQSNREESSFASEQALHIKQKIEHRKGKQKKLKNILLALTVALVVLGAVTVYSQYKLYTLSKAELNVGQAGTQAAIAGQATAPKTPEEVISALSRHILLPKGVPQIAEVQDAPKLRDTQAFFKDAENGDIVVVYETTIFLYRPSLDVLVSTGDISGQGQLKP